MRWGGGEVCIMDYVFLVVYGVNGGRRNCKSEYSIFWFSQHRHKTIFPTSRTPFQHCQRKPLGSRRLKWLPSAKNIFNIGQYPR